VHDRGSNGASAWVGAVGACSVDTVGADVAVLDGVPFEVPDEEDLAGAGAFTEKFEPVTTVTSAPKLVGALPKVAVPVSECNTCSAAARWLGDE
jgi:hypothetical protein